MGWNLLKFSGKILPQCVIGRYWIMYTMYNIRKRQQRANMGI